MQGVVLAGIIIAFIGATIAAVIDRRDSVTCACGDRQQRHAESIGACQDCDCVKYEMRELRLR